MERRIIALAREVIAREPKKRPEAERIREWASRLARAEGTGSLADLDRLIYTKMYGELPVRAGALKIRYWRTGHHIPRDREEALLFARALGLDEAETLYLLQTVMEKSDRIFSDGEWPDAEYVRRAERMEEMLREYIAGVPPARMIQLDIPYERLNGFARHLFCIDALQASALAAEASEAAVIENHMSSINYEAEFLRICRLQGEIPRRVMLRHIFLLGLPYLNRRLVDERLRELGYLPLTEGHTNPVGALADDLVIGILSLYESECSGKDPLECRSWLLEQLRALDLYLRDSGRDGYRFLCFRSLATMARF